jgi:predicted outer membrane repeat protein
MNKTRTVCGLPIGRVLSLTVVGAVLLLAGQGLAGPPVHTGRSPIADARTASAPSGLDPKNFSRQDVLDVINSIRGNVIIVDWHGTWDYDNIQDAVDAAQEGDTIIVLPSTGSPDGAYVENVVIQDKVITLRSIFPDDPTIVAETVIDGNATSGVVGMSDGAAGSALDGLTIRNGQGSWGRWAGGVTCQASLGSPVTTIRRCVVESNVAEPDDLGGGGICIFGGSALIDQCDIRGNTAPTDGGGIYVHGDVVLSNCRIEGNTSDGGGGGMFHTGGSLTLLETAFVDNWASCGGGLMVVRDFEPETEFVAANCRFLRNHADSGGGIGNSMAPMQLVNCVLTGNSATSAGGALAVWHTSSPSLVEPYIVNCTLFANTSSTAGSALWTFGSVPTLANCIVYGNTSDDGGGPFSYVAEDPPQAVSSCIEGGWPGDGNIDADPMMVNANGVDNILGTDDDDFRLLGGSPCIDAGSVDALPADTIDLDSDGDTAEPLPLDFLGLPRVADGFVDMGAFEGAYQGFIISGDPVTATEGIIRRDVEGTRGVGAFLVRLAMEPTEPVTANVARLSGDPDLTVFMGETLVFDASNYDQYQPVILAAGEDIDWSEGMAMFTVSAEGLPTADVTAFEEENDPVPAVVYVDSTAQGEETGLSWTDAFTRLRGALDQIAARPGSQEVWVAEGTHRPAPAGGDRSASFALHSGVAWYGGFPSGGGTWEDRAPEVYRTTLSGDLNSDDLPGFVNCDENSLHVVECDSCDETAVLDGFVIRGGNADLAQLPNRVGGGLLIDSGSPVIRNCAFEQNRAYSSSYQYACTGGGAHIMGSGSPLFERCLFSENEAIGYGGAMSIEAPATPVIVDCVFASNVAGYWGGGIFNGWVGSPGVQVRNCLFFGNETGVLYSMAAIDLADCTVVNNQGGVLVFGEAMITNTIIYGNDAGGGEQLSADNATVTYCNIEGGWPGEGNIDADPMFVAGPLGCYYLSQTAAGQQLDSPCIDAGSDTAANLGFDMLTTRRDEVGDSGIVDMGYHYPITGEPFTRGDFDRDGDIDLDDFAEWAAHLTGPCAAEPCWPAVYADPCASIGDFDDDGDLDLRDFAGLQVSFGVQR